MKRETLILFSLLILSSACSAQGRLPPTPIPTGVLVQEIPAEMDIIFDSIRYVLSETPCLDDDFQIEENFIHQPGCNARIYDPQEAGLASPRQLFTLDLETGNVLQITNLDCFFTLGQVVDPRTLMVLAACADTDQNGKINENDKPELYLFDLEAEELDCLTCELGLTSINNPDYSHANKSVVFSAQYSTSFHNYLFRVDANKNLIQITNQSDYMDFDCSWSEDGTKIVFSRLPAPWFSQPSQVWLMDSDGTNLEIISDGGPNPTQEGHHGPFPIGIDADPDLSPDNKKIVFSRLKTGLENVPFGIYELLVVDVETKAVEILDSQYANMVPQWKARGILMIRQIGAAEAGEIEAMNIKQRLTVYQDGNFVELETYPFDVFPLGAYGGYWIESE